MEIGPGHSETKYAARDKPGAKAIYFGPDIAQLRQLKSKQQRQYQLLVQSLPQLERVTMLREARKARRLLKREAQKRAARR